MNYTSIGKVDVSVHFTPLATVIGFVFLGSSFAILALAKLFYASADHFMTNNRFDLVIFKLPNKKSPILPRRINRATRASEHNLRAAKLSGYDFSKLNDRNYMKKIDGLRMPMTSKHQQSAFNY